jgi:hypothetical protein
MPPTPLTATYRMAFKYTVSGFQHKCQMFLDCVAGAGTPPYDTVPRAGGAAAAVSTLVDAFFNKIKTYYKSADTSFQGADLEHRVGTEWQWVATITTSVTPTGSVAFQPANGDCFMGKDTDNKRLPAFIYEGDFGSPTKLVSLPTPGSDNRNMVDYFFGTGVIADTDAYIWRMSRNKKYAGHWLSIVVDSNEKLRRFRHIK